MALLKQTFPISRFSALIGKTTGMPASKSTTLSAASVSEAVCCVFTLFADPVESSYRDSSISSLS